MSAVAVTAFASALRSSWGVILANPVVAAALFVVLVLAYVVMQAWRVRSSRG
jgi:hypothetical protein